MNDVSCYSHDVQDLSETVNYQRTQIQELEELVRL